MNETDRQSQNWIFPIISILVVESFCLTVVCIRHLQFEYRFEISKRKRIRIKESIGAWFVAISRSVAQLSGSAVACLHHK